MGYDRIPLKEQLKRVAEGRIVFPSYPACAIRAWADTPIAAYLGGNSEKGEERRRRLRELLHISQAQEEEMSYRDAAQRIAARLQEETGCQAKRAVRLLAEPLGDAYLQWKEAKEHAEDTKNTP